MILFHLKKPTENKPDERRAWQQAAIAIEQSVPKAENIFWSREGFLVLLDGNASPFLAQAITFAANCQVPYKLIFVEKATEWDWKPPVA